METSKNTKKDAAMNESKLLNKIISIPTYWFGDEMAKMLKISRIEQGLTFGRSKNLLMFPGTQDNLQLEGLYGKEKASSIINGAGQKAFFAQGGYEPANFCAKNFGTSRVINKNKGTRMGDKGEEITRTDSRDNKYDEVLDSELLNLPPLTCFFTSEFGTYTKLSIAYHEVEQMREGNKGFEMNMKEAETMVQKKRYNEENNIDDSEIEINEDEEMLI